MTSYRDSLALGGTDIRNMVTDFDAWLFDRKLRLDGTVLPWLQKEPSPAAQFGTAVHMAVLEPERYDTLAVVMPYCENFALKEGRAYKADAQDKCTTPDHFIMRHEHHWAIQQTTKPTPSRAPPGRCWNWQPSRRSRPGCMRWKSATR